MPFSEADGNVLRLIFRGAFHIHIVHAKPYDICTILLVANLFPSLATGPTLTNGASVQGLLSQGPC